MLLEDGADALWERPELAAQLADHVMQTYVAGRVQPEKWFHGVFAAAMEMRLARLDQLVAATTKDKMNALAAERPSAQDKTNEAIRRLWAAEDHLIEVARGSFEEDMKALGEPVGEADEPGVLSPSPHFRKEMRDTKNAKEEEAKGPPPKPIDIQHGDPDHVFELHLDRIERGP